MASSALYKGFLGEWLLVPESCSYEQGEAPITGLYAIAEVEGGLEFKMGWMMSEDGEQHAHSFICKPDGKPYAFSGGDLADAISVTAATETSLDSAAFYKGVERMSATRTLVEGGAYMDVVQKVHLPDGTAPENYARYSRKN